MTLISFQHSIKYIYLQLAPYAGLTIAAGYMAAGLNFSWLVIYLATVALLAWRFITLTATQYFFTHDMLVICRGVFFKEVDCRSLWQLRGMELRHNRLLRWLDISHLHCGMEGPPADRIRLVGIDDHTLLTLLDQLQEGIEANTKLWREHFRGAST